MGVVPIPYRGGKREEREGVVSKHQTQINLLNVMTTTTNNQQLASFSSHVLQVTSENGGRIHPVAIYGARDMLKV